MNEVYPVAILAGGLGTRLGDLTKATPKCMVEVAGAPFIDYVLNLLVSQDVRRVVFCVGHLGEQVEDFVGDGLRYGLQITYSYDGPKQLGTAGALRKALPLLGEKFFVLYGDSYLPCDLQAMRAAFDRTSARAMMAVCKVPPGYTPNARYESERILAYGKRSQVALTARHIDYGIGIMQSMALPPFIDDLSSVYNYHAACHQLAGYEVTGRFHTIGTPAGMAECEEFLSASAIR